jgi:rSAM/selenodomain-associated transferase 1
MIQFASEEVADAVVVMAKAPREGSVKTRLAVEYPPRDVVQLSECMLHDTLALVQTLSRTHVAVMCPSEDVAELARRLPPAVQVVGQHGRGLAAALASVFERFVPRFRRVVAVDSDSPHLPVSILRSAFDLLEQSDVVVGPTEDGGYYLVGASATHPRLFDSAPLGTGNARDALLGNARALGLSVVFTQCWYDVDLPSDLRRLAAELRLEPERAPRTAALFASWHAIPDGRDDVRVG